MKNQPPFVNILNFEFIFASYFTKGPAFYGPGCI